MQTHNEGPVPPVSKQGDEVLVQQDKTNKLSTAFNLTPFKVVRRNGNSLMIESPTGKQYSRNTSHVKQYVNDPRPQQEPDVLTTPVCRYVFKIKHMNTLILIINLVMTLLPFFDQDKKRRKVKLIYS